MLSWQDYSIMLGWTRFNPSDVADDRYGNVALSSRKALGREFVLSASLFRQRNKRYQNAAFGH